MSSKKKFLDKDFKDKTFLITGGTGSFGKHCLEILVNYLKPKKVIIFHGNINPRTISIFKYYRDEQARQKS